MWEFEKKLLTELWRKHVMISLIALILLIVILGSVSYIRRNKEFDEIANLSPLDTCNKYLLLLRTKEGGYIFSLKKQYYTQNTNDRIYSMIKQKAHELSKTYEYLDFGQTLYQVDNVFDGEISDANGNMQYYFFVDLSKESRIEHTIASYMRQDIYSNNQQLLNNYSENRGKIDSEDIINQLDVLIDTIENESIYTKENAILAQKIYKELSRKNFFADKVGFAANLATIAGLFL